MDIIRIIRELRERPRELKRDNHLKRLKHPKTWTKTFHQNISPNFQGEIIFKGPEIILSNKAPTRNVRLKAVSDAMRSSKRMHDAAFSWKKFARFWSKFQDRIDRME